MSDFQGKMGVPKYREEVSEILSECYSRDLMDLTEFERRQVLVQEAQTMEDLQKIVADAPQEITLGITKGHGSTSLLAEFSRKERTSFCLMGSRKLKGGALESQETSSITVMGETAMDFRDVAFPAKPVVVNLVNVMGETRIVVPPDIPVDVEVFTLMGETKETRKVNVQTVRNQPGLIIRGICLMGEVKVTAKD